MILYSQSADFQIQITPVCLSRNSFCALLHLQAYAILHTKLQAAIRTDLTSWTFHILPGVNSADGSSYVAITGSDTAPVGNFCDEGYFQNFRDIKRITDTNLNYDSTSIESKDYYDYGDTLVLTDAVKGKERILR